MDAEALRPELRAAYPGIDGLRLASLLVGRWPSGLPIVESPERDDPAKTALPFALEHFSYRDPVAMRVTSPASGEEILLPAGADDPAGRVCPFAAHVRKVNPRNDPPELGSHEATLQRRILRRGITYGSPSRDVREDDGVDRGLVFVSYQTSIEHQFEFLSRNWMNSSVNPNGGGHDLIVGQSSTPTRRRRATLSPSFGRNALVNAADEWVIPTGGGYFFSPSISALKHELATPA